jgi:hypothetical protein
MVDGAGSVILAVDGGDARAGREFVERERLVRRIGAVA